MKKYIALLRGINVGGKRKLPMADLKELMAKLSYKDVKTYIQSGNVIFNADNSLKNDDLANTISSAIEKQFLYDVPVIVKSVSEWDKYIENNPYKSISYDDGQVHITVLKTVPDIDLVNKLMEVDSEPDRFSVIGDAVYILCKGSYHKSKLSNTFIEKQLKTSATTRNWKTVLKIAELYD